MAMNLANKDLIPSNVSVNGVDVSNMSVDDATKAIKERMSKKTTIPVQYQSSKKTVTIAAITEQQAHDMAESAYDSKPFIIRSIPYSKRLTITPTLETDSLQKALDDLFMKTNAVQEPSIHWSQNDQKFIVTKGSEGDSIDVTSFRSGLNDYLTDGKTVVVSDVKAKPKVSDEAAQKLADSTNASISKSYNYTVDGSTKTATTSELASWFVFSTSGPSITWDAKATQTNISKTLQSYAIGLVRQMVPTTTMMTPDGSTKVAVISYGQDGKEVTNVPELVTATYKALESQTPTTFVFKTKDVASVNKTVNAPGDFTSPNGSPWIQVNLSEQKVYAYKGSTLVNTFNVATGAATSAKHTDNGTFYVNVKYTTQTMRGADYVTPNVRWISYFNGGEGFHAAPWNYSNIARGVASSHGCVNMITEQAQWIYDFAPIGTKVEVVGTTPSSAVR
jgi:lipoprotein-anchoring transpeptidase ErfK/SrfK